MQRVKLEDFLEEHGVLVIDGAMSTPLENMGCDLNDSLWTAKTLIEKPELIKQVHTDYFEAGANCGITASYQSSFAGLTAKGYSEQEAQDLIVRSVELLRQARDDWHAQNPDRPYPFCLASVGPYGAYLADGSEYRGNYGISDQDLRDFHYDRAKLLWEAGADLLLFETIPSLDEALICAQIAEQLGADYWISFSCSDGHHINENQVPITDCAKALSQFPNLKMIGVNCTQPEFIESLIKDIKSVSDLAIAVYPNSGEVYDPETKTWTSGNSQAKSFEENTKVWLQAGAQAVGGCCTTVASHIQQIVKAKNDFSK